MRTQALRALRPARCAVPVGALCRGAAALVRPCPPLGSGPGPAPSSTSAWARSQPQRRAASTATAASRYTPTARAASTSTRTAKASEPAFVDEDLLFDDASLPPLPTAGGGANGDVGTGASAKKIDTPQQLSSALAEDDEADLEEGDDAELSGPVDWTSSFHGLSTMPFSPETATVLMRPINQEDIEMKPDGILYMPEIKYRRILNQAFGPGAWGLAPRGKLVVGEKVVTREYALIVHGRFVAQARGENPYFGDDTIPTASEGCKSNALMRCCKDLGIASELWDPRFIRSFKKEHCREIWVEHVVNKRRRQIWTRKDTEPGYPYTIPKNKF